MRSNQPRGKPYPAAKPQRLDSVWKDQRQSFAVELLDLLENAAIEVFFHEEVDTKVIRGGWRIG